MLLLQKDYDFLKADNSQHVYFFICFFQFAYLNCTIQKFSIYLELCNHHHNSQHVYFFIWLHLILVVACRIFEFHCGMQDVSS